MIIANSFAVFATGNNLNLEVGRELIEKAENQRINSKEIIDYEVSKRMSSGSKDVETEKPSWSSTEHSPEEKKPKDSWEIKDAVLEAISSSKAEM